MTHNGFVYEKYVFFSRRSFQLQRFVIKWRELKYNESWRIFYIRCYVHTGFNSIAFFENCPCVSNKHPFHSLLFRLKFAL